MGFLDALFGGGGDTSNTNANDPTGAYLGNLIDPATARQYQEARAQQAIAGLSAGLLAGSGPSRMPVPFGSALGQGLLQMQSAQNALPQQALQAAQTQNQVGDSQYKKLQGLGLLQNMQFLSQQADAARRAYAGGGSAASPTGGVSPSSPSMMNPTGDYADKVVSAELGGAPNSAKNPRSSATGPGQFIDSTWLDLARKTFPAAAQMGDDALLALRSDPDTSKAMTNAYARQNAPVLAQAGIPINDATLYAAHFLGPAGATKVLTASPDTPLSNLLDPKAIKANPNLKGKTAGDFAGMMTAKMGGTGGGAPGQAASPVQLAAMNGTAGGDNATFLAHAFGQAQPGGAASGPLGAAPGNVNVQTGGAPQVGGGMPLPPGVTQDQVNAARLANSFATMRGGTPDPYLAGLGIYGLDTSKAAANSNAEQQARATWAGPHAFNTAAAQAPFEMVDATINGVDVKVPKSTYMQMVQQYGPQVVQGGNPSMQGPAQTMQGPSQALQGGPMVPPPLPRQPMPGTNLMPGAGSSLMPRQGPPVTAGGGFGPSSGNPAPTFPGAPTASATAPIGQPSGMPMLGKPTGPFGYSYKLPTGTGPGQDQPMPMPATPDHPYSTIMPPLSEQSVMRGSSPAAFDEAQKAWNVTTGKMTAAIPDMQTSKQILGAMSDIFHRYESGTFAQAQSELVAKLQTIVPAMSGINNPSDMQQILKDNFAASIAKMKATGLTRWTQMELKSTSENFANPNLRPAANFNIIAQDMGKIMQAEAFTHDWMIARRNAQGPLNVDEFQDSWYGRNSLNSFVDRAKATMGPFKGMSQQEIANSMPHVNSPDDLAKGGFTPGMQFIGPDNKLHTVSG